MPVPYSHNKRAIFPITEPPSEFEITYDGTINYLGSLQIPILQDILNLQTKVRKEIFEIQQGILGSHAYHTMVPISFTLGLLLTFNVLVWYLISYEIAVNIFNDVLPSSVTEWIHLLAGPIFSFMSIAIAVAVITRFMNRNNSIVLVENRAVSAILVHWIAEMNIKYANQHNIEYFKYKESPVAHQNNASEAIYYESARKLRWIEIVLKYQSSDFHEVGLDKNMIQAKVPFQVFDDRTPLLAPGASISYCSSGTL